MRCSPSRQEQFAQARQRAGQAGHAVSFGSTDAEFAAGMALAEILIGAPGTFAGRFPCPAPKLRMIFCTAAGLDKLMPFDWLPPGVDAAEQPRRARRQGVGIRDDGAADAERAPARRDRRPTAGHWQPHFAPTLRGRRVSIIGTGDLGSAAARGARHFGAEVTGVRRRPEPHPDFSRIVATEALDALLPDTEFLILACPLTPATRNLMDRRRLALLPQGAGVVNIGRGALLDQDALCDLLDGGHLGGAVLDVFTPEPVPPGHRLWTTRNLIATPHVSADDPLRYNPDSLDIFFRNLQAWQAGGALPNRVDLVQGY